MFQFDPCQFDRSTFRVRYCCCEPELIWVSIFESAMKPPLAQPPLSSSTIEPFTWMRRSAVPWDVAQTSVPLSIAAVGTTARFSAVRQKLHVALSAPSQSAFARTAPVMTTSSGDAPRPITCV